MLDPVSPLLPDWLTCCAKNTPDQLAVECDQTRWSFAELFRQAKKLASQLAALGIREDSRVALLASNSLAYIAFVHALTRLGAILIPLNTRLTQTEICWQLNDSRAVLLVSETDLLERARGITTDLPDLLLITLHTLSPNPETTRTVLRISTGIDCGTTPIDERPLIDLNMTQAIMYTSGTTGHPKGVLITYGMQWWNALGSALKLGHDANDCWLACLPLFHIGGFSILMKSVIYGIRVVLHKKFDEHAINQAIHSQGVTMISVVAAMLQRMLLDLALENPKAHYPTALRCVLLGGGPAPRSLLKRCASLDIPVAQTYGLTESCSQAVTLSPADALRKQGSAGLPLLTVQIQIREENKPLAARQTGVIYLRGPSITPGYADRPDVTAEVLQDGWFCTGDLGYLDEDGYLHVLDRRSDLIISGGENIYPAEIENVLLSHPAIADAGVCGIDDPQWGQVPVAFVKLHSNKKATATALLKYAEQRLARYKVPRALYFVDELPRNSLGKLLRRNLHRLR